MTTIGGPILSGDTINNRILSKIMSNTHISSIVLLDFHLQDNPSQEIQLHNLFVNDSVRHWSEIQISLSSGPFTKIVEAFIDRCESLKINSCTFGHEIMDVVGKNVHKLTALRWRQNRMTERDITSLLCCHNQRQQNHKHQQQQQQQQHSKQFLSPDHQLKVDESPPDVLLQSQSNLKHLDLGDTEFDDAAVEALATVISNQSNLTTLHLFGCDLADCQIAQLVRSLPPNLLEQLYLGRNKCRSKGLQELSTLLSASNCTLLKLDLYEQQIRRDGASVSNHDAQDDREDTQDDDTNDTDDIDSITEVAYITLGRAVSTNRSLQHLSLSYNPMSPEHLEYLLGGLHDNNTLQSLDLSQCSLGCSGMKVLSKHIRVMAIFQLDVSGHQNLSSAEYSTTVLPELVKALESNTSLTVLYFPQYHYEDQVGNDAITNGSNDSNTNTSEQTRYLRDLARFYLDSNKGGRRLLQYADANDNFIPRNLWPTILARVDECFWNEDSARRRASVLYGMLRESLILLETWKT